MMGPQTLMRASIEVDVEGLYNSRCNNWGLAIRGLEANRFSYQVQHR